MKERYIDIYMLKKFHNFNFTMTRIGEEFYMEFLQHYADEFRAAKNRNELNENVFSKNEWKKLNEIMESPETYYNIHYVTYDNQVKNERSVGLLKKTVDCFQENGLRYTLKKIKEKLF